MIYELLAAPNAIVSAASSIQRLCVHKNYFLACVGHPEQIIKGVHHLK
jgi:hypothetical protein